MPKVKGTTTGTEPALVMLDPSEILAEGNIRYAAKDVSILKDDITRVGQVLESCEVEPLATAQNGYKYRLVFGFRRHQAVTELNREGAGLKLPCTVHVTADSKERSIRQITENLNRESMSIMDQAVAMKGLLESGMPRAEVRELFARKGGAKGRRTPISNAYLNMLVSFVDFPKKIRDRIHNDTITVQAAYELRKAPADKWDGILDRIEAEMAKDITVDEKEEQRLLKEQTALQAAEGKQKEAADALAKVQEFAATKQAAVKSRTEEADRLYAASKVKGLDKDQKKAAEQAFAKAESERKAAEAEALKAEEEVRKLKSKAETAAKLAQERKDRLAKAREDKAGKKSVGATEIKKAAAAETGSAPVPLTSAEMRKVVEYLCLPDGTEEGELVQEIGKVLKDTFAGVLTEKQCAAKIKKIVS